MNRQIRGQGLTCQQMLHLEEIAPGDWRGVDFERSGGLCIYTWQTVITRIADLIGGGHVYVLEVSQPPNRVHIDRAGNIWLDNNYLSPHTYLPLLIPENL